MGRLKLSSTPGKRCPRWVRSALAAGVIIALAWGAVQICVSDSTRGWLGLHWARLTGRAGEAVSTPASAAPPADMETDDQLQDKHPVFEPAFTELVSFDDKPAWFNRSAAVIGLDLLPEKAEAGGDKLARLYPNFAEAYAAGHSLDGTVLPSLDMLDAYTKYTDDHIVAAIEDRNHDGGSIYPGGKQNFLLALVDALNPLLPGRSEKQGQVDTFDFTIAAYDLGLEPDNYLEHGRHVGCSTVSRKKEFLAHPFRSKPVGLYTQTERLRQVFRRDRFLQQPFGLEELNPGVTRFDPAYDFPHDKLIVAVRIAEALKQDPQLLKAYTDYLRLGEALSAPSANLNLLDLLAYEQYFGDLPKLAEALRNSPQAQLIAQRGTADLGVAVWPFVTSKENRLFAQLYASVPPKGATTMQELVDALRSGQLNLAPAPDSGWYDYQLYALEPLLLTERALEFDQLLLHAGYKVRLRTAFEAMYAQRRETLVKYPGVDLVCGIDGSYLPEELPYPRLSVEPAGTNYLRTARGYAMLEGRLTALLGAEELAATPLADSSSSLFDAIRQARATFLSICLLSCNDLSLAPQLEPGELDGVQFTESRFGVPPSTYISCTIDNLPTLSAQDAQQRGAACQIAAAWTWHLSEAPSSRMDPRVIVPVLTDGHGKKVWYWAVLGVKLAQIETYYAAKPRAIAQKGQGGASAVDREAAVAALSAEQGLAELSFEEHIWVIPVYVFREVILRPDPPTREELRAICDQAQTADKIVKQLQAQFGP